MKTLRVIVKTLCHNMLLAVWFWAQAVALTPLLAADRPARTAEASPNAADIYRQAFAAIPLLAGEQKTKYEAATTTATASLADDLKPIVARFDAALRELRRARGVATCDWNLDVSTPFSPFPHLSKAQELSRAAILRARLQFDAGATDEAIADVVAVLKLARDCAGSSLFISLAVDRALEKMASEVLAANLPRLTAHQLDRLAAELRDLPATPSTADCMRHEGRVIGDWMERLINAEAAKLSGTKDGGKILDAVYEAANGPPPPCFKAFTVADVRESVRLLRAHYAELTRILDLPPADRDARLAEWKVKVVGMRPTSPADRVRRLAWDFVPRVDAFTKQGDRVQSRRELLRLAIEAQRHGPDAITGATIPGQGIVKFRKTRNGFELSCQTASAPKSPSPTSAPVPKASTKPAPRAALLEVGSQAPPLRVAKWIQGEPVTAFARDKAYLVEFWATWCGPCRNSIPHLNTISKNWKDRGLVVIGQNVWDNDGNVKPFIEKMRDKMTYPVALDDKTATEKGTMAETWLNAAQCGGIPWAFLVGKDGKIVWIGHPMELEDSVIEQVLAGTFDFAKAAAEKKTTEAAAHAAKMASMEPEVPVLRVGVDE